MRQAWRLDALDKARDALENRMARLEQRVGDLTKADEIAEAVAAKLDEKQTEKLTEGQIVLNHWQVTALKWGIPTAILAAIGSPVISHFV